MNVRSLLFDALKIMQTSEIKLKMQLGKLDVDYEGDDEEPPELIKVWKFFLGNFYSFGSCPLWMPLSCLLDFLGCFQFLGKSSDIRTRIEEPSRKILGSSVGSR